MSRPTFDLYSWLRFHILEREIDLACLEELPVFVSSNGIRNKTVFSKRASERRISHFALSCLIPDLCAAAAASTYLRNAPRA